MTTLFPDDDAIARHTRAFVDRSLPKSAWTHAGHFAAALWLLRHEPEPPVAARMPGLIRAYNEAVGGQNTDTAGYHETITQASLTLARALLDAHPADRPLHEILDLLMASRLGDPDWLLDHWSKARLFSPAARRAWLAPDLEPLP